jgi:Leucine-rich repeat (LRR) protein
MKSLALSENHFEGRLPELAGFSNLVALDLSNNRLNGKIPDSWSQLSNLISMDISNNAGVSGTLPYYIFWPSLKSLLFAETEISGPISQIITNFTSLGTYKGDEILNSKTFLIQAIHG